MSDKKSTVLYMDWNEFEMCVKSLAQEIRESKLKISNIYGMPRGGLVIAVRLSHLLGLPLITNSNLANSQTLYVDDCVDSGRTLQYAQNWWKVAVIYYNPDASFKPQFFVYKKTNTEWIEFPWESAV